ncbi:alpha/beta hydrolase [Ahniella affigens]|uniref:Alpha/beta hydrolase n=1 Tax=Ahniella affigens TaxID=2021234 RepID=A0A2P1PVP3_9GAMM|nr:alpha/beta hydrolase [Ahniella affigens]AVP98923.1 alpha/beta hydrolase [Ahniella affigens]
MGADCHEARRIQQFQQSLISWAVPVSAGYTLRGQHSTPSGKPVLHFIHGNGYCGLVYSPLLALLSLQFDLVLSDMQGHGDTDHGGRFHGWNRSAESALEAWQLLAPRFGTAPTFAMGHSFGGVLTALMLAASPRTFRAAVLLDPVLFTPAIIGVMAVSEPLGLSKLFALPRQAKRRRRHWPDRAAAGAQLKGRGMFRGWEDVAFDAYLQHALMPASDGGVTLKCRPSREAEIFASYPRRLWQQLGNVRTPVSLLYGDRTFDFVAASAQSWTAQNGNVQAFAVAGGHCFMQEDAATTAQHVLKFLSAHLET